jgi:hypothetical protein
MFFRKLIFAFIILLFIGLAHAQMVSNVAGSTFFLNENFIKNNRIKSINGSISSKRDLQPIIQTGLEQFFEFYPNGKLYFSAETYFLGNGEKDTSIRGKSYKRESAMPEVFFLIITSMTITES